MKLSEGDELVLEALVDGVPPPKVEWLLDDKLLTTSNRLATSKDGKTHRLIVNNVSSDDGGEYKIVASNKSASTSFSAEVLINKVRTPTGKMVADTIKVAEGDDACFEVIAENTECVVWYRGDDVLKKGRRYDISQNNDGLCKLVVMRCRSVDAGLYTCELVNGSKKAELKMTLTLDRVDLDVDEEDGKRDLGKWVFFSLPNPSPSQCVRFLCRRHCDG